MDLIYVLVGFGVISVAASRIARFFLNVKLPLITGFLITGIVTGPFILDLIHDDAAGKLYFINDISLAFIAFAAGSELYLKELRSRYRSIAWNTFGQLVITFGLGSLSVYLLADFIPFMADLSDGSKVAISILAGTIFVARSPASAIAVINELRAKGPFTQTAIGVTVVKDVLVIILFAICFALSGNLISGDPFSLSFLGILFAELILSFGLGFVLGKVLSILLRLHLHKLIKTALTLAVGFGVYFFSHAVRDWSAVEWGHEFYLEPLLICIIGSFVVSNYSASRLEWEELLHDTGPPVYVAFFTLTGASMEIDVLLTVWSVALILFAIRIITMILGGFVGGLLGGDPMKFARINWMPFVTQAGVSLGLATIIANEYPSWGPQFATVIIAVIVLNQIVGPPLFKWSLFQVEEAHVRAQTPSFDGVRDALICGLHGQSLALARSLMSHGWNVKIATTKAQKEIDTLNLEPGIQISSIDTYNKEALASMGAAGAEAIVTMKSDDANYRICEMAYEHFGTKEIIVRLNDRTNLDKFHQLGALIVDPSTAIVSLLDHMVRSPQATSMILGTDEGQDTVELEVRNPDLAGMFIRELRLPLDVIVLNVCRKGQLFIPHGSTELKIGDLLTLVGSPESLENVSLRVEEA
ncbi:MAG: monovalent cation:proton antiporter family protein [Bacteroidota bacterium]